jgi:hypothetical protein
MEVTRRLVETKIEKVIIEGRNCRALKAGVNVFYPSRLGAIRRAEEFAD